VLSLVSEAIGPGIDCYGKESVASVGIVLETIGELMGMGVKY
jgi:hypothetical protein